MYGAKTPMALEPPPTQATMMSGCGRPVEPSSCVCNSSPMIRWNSRTIHGNGMRPDHRADDVVRVLDRGDPSPHRGRDGVLERAGSRIRPGPRSAPSSRIRYHVERLPLDVGGTHVHGALQSEQRAGCGGRDPVLTRTGLGDHLGLAHPPGQQRLTDRVVDLVGAGVGEVLTFQPEIETEALRQSLGPEHRRGAAHEIAEEGIELGLEGLVCPAASTKAVLEFGEGRHQGFGGEPTAVVTETVPRSRVRPLSCPFRLPDEGGDLSRVLDPRTVLQTRGRIDAPGAHFAPPRRRRCPGSDRPPARTGVAVARSPPNRTAHRSRRKVGRVRCRGWGSGRPGCPLVRVADLSAATATGLSTARPRAAAAAQAAALCLPWGWTPSAPVAAAAAITSSGSASAVTTNRGTGTLSMRAAARSTVTRRTEVGAITNPTASAPASTATATSSGRVNPQTLTQVIRRRRGCAESRRDHRR